MQDNDPIRRTCFGSGTSGVGTLAEDTCSHSGDLGLVLTMNNMPETADMGTTSDPLRYNATPCARSHNVSASAPDAFDAVTQGKVICPRGLLCPNGDVCNNLGGCIVPADANNNPQCLANRLTTPAVTISVAAVPAVHATAPGIAEGRAYNQHLYKQVGTAAGYQNNAFTTALPMVGAFYRIHTNHSLNPASTTTTPITCGNPGTSGTLPHYADMSDQIGCLVNASPCSFGVGGITVPGVDSIKIDAQSPFDLCVQGNGGSIPAYSYPLANKIYLNTIPGFVAATGNEQALVGCETDLAQLNPPLPAASPAGIMTAQIAAAGIIPIPMSYNSGEPFCEDFNEQMLCGATVNVQSCPTVVPSNYTAFPTANSTTCGNGIQEAFEQCDCGVAPPGPGPLSPSTNVTNCGATFNGGTVCSTTCRLVH
jgi:hypothetical protein